SLSEPGPVYLFRAHVRKEMERRMTDLSVDLFTNLHQPLLDTMYGSRELSESCPQFVRMYISKNRSLLASSRDEKYAKIAILSGMSAGKPFTPAPEARGYSPGTKMVRVKARVMIAKPVGERHDMITVGDLDCPSAWTTIACVRAFDFEVDVPQRFEKGTLSKIRHEVVLLSPNSKHKLSPEHEQMILDALDLKSLATTPYSQESSNMDVRSATSTPSAQPSPTLGGVLVKRTGASPISLSKSLLRTVTSPEWRESIPKPEASEASKQIDAEIIVPALGSKENVGSEARLVMDAPDTGPTGSISSKPSLLAKAQQVPAALYAIMAGPASNIHATSPRTPTYMQTAAYASPSLPRGWSPAVTSAASASSVVASSAWSSPSISAPSSSSVPSVIARGSLSSEIVSPSVRQTRSEFSPILLTLEGSGSMRELTARGRYLLLDLKVVAREKNVPYTRWDDIEPTLTVDSAQGLFKRIYHVEGDDGLVVQNFKEMDTESFEQRVREVACLLKLRGLEGVGQIQSIIDDEKDQLVGLSMTKYAYTLKDFATNARRHPSPCQKLSLVRDMVAAVSAIHGAGLAHRDLSEVNIMVDEDPVQRLADNTPRPWVRIIDFGKSVFVEREEVKRWSMKEQVPEEELALLPLVVLPPDHGYKLYRSILTLPRSKYDHTPLPPVDPRSEDVYSLGVLIWRTFSGKSPWSGAIEDDIKRLRYIVSTDEQIQFEVEREVIGKRSRELLMKCLTAEAETRSTARQLQEWLEQPEVLQELRREFEIIGGGRKKTRKKLD
ncbi:hypothetical protein BGX28_004522, partial [Mortierella sp. GBA30]